MNPPIRVLGIGSPFGADRAGWIAIDRLEAAGLPARFPEVHFERLDRPGAALLSHLAGARGVVLIDALAGGEPGRSRELTLPELAHHCGASSHGFGVADALALAEALGEGPAQLRLFGIEVGGADAADGFDFGPLVALVTEALCGLCGG